MAHASNPMVFLDDGRAYSLDVHRSEDTYYVSIVNDRGSGVTTFVGSSHELHALFLGLHNVLVDAGQAQSGRSTLTIPVTTPKGDERGGSSGE